MLWTAFLLGLLGGLHCVAMCGPIALALPSGKGISRIVLSRTLYNSGRIFTYSMLGILTGLVGTGVQMAGYQQVLSIVAGVLLLFIVVATGFKSLEVTYLQPFIQLANALKRVFSRLMKRTSLGGSFLIGVTNGFLPCGLVYVALAASLAAGSMHQSMIYMAVFGAGTFPLMFALSFSGNYLTVQVRRRLSRLVPWVVLAMGVLFILRGMNLGIPYVSPMSPTSQTQFEMCS